MKKIAFVLSSLCFGVVLASEDYQRSECYQKYVSKHQSKVDDRERQLSIMTFGYPITPAGGETIYLRPNNYKIDEIDFFERDVLSAADFDLKAYSNSLRSSFSPPSFLKESYEFIKKEVPTVTYHEVQVALREGFKDGDYCKWYGIFKPKKVAKVMVQKVQEIRRELATVSGLEVNDSERVGEKVIPSKKAPSVKENSATQK